MSLDNRDLHAAFDDAGGDGVAGQAGGVVDVELVHEALAVFFHGFDADVQDLGAFLVRFALGDELEHLHLPRGENVGVFFEYSSPRLRDLRR